jgi:succinate-acetate transporter protein
VNTKLELSPSQEKSYTTEELLANAAPVGLYRNATNCVVLVPAGAGTKEWDSRPVIVHWKMKHPTMLRGVSGPWVPLPPGASVTLTA